MALQLLACDASGPADSASTSSPGTSPGTPELRLVVCGKEAAERVVALGAGAAIRAADVASLSLPGAGTALSLGPRCAAAERLGPSGADLALLAGAAADAATPLEALGLPVRVLDPESLNQVVEIHQELGALLGREIRARILVADMTREIAAIATRRDGRNRRRVAWLVGRGDAAEGWEAVGPAGILHEILELAGADNAFHAQAPAPARIRVDAAAIAAAAPDLVLVDADVPDPPAPGAASPVERVPPELSRLPILDPLPRVRQLHELLYPQGEASS